MECSYRSAVMAPGESDRSKHVTYKAEHIGLSENSSQVFELKSVFRRFNF